MKHFKRALSILLVLVMTFTLTVPAFAAEKKYRDYGTYMCVGDSIAAGTSLTRSGEECVFDQDIPQEDVWGVWDDDYIYRGFNYERVPTAYHALIQDDLSKALGHEVKLIQAARGGMRAIEFRYLLDGVYTDDMSNGWADSFFHFSGDSFTLDELDDLNRQVSKGQVGRYTDYFAFTEMEGEPRTDNVQIDGFVDAIRKSDLISLNLGSNDVLTCTFSVVMAALEEEYTIPGLSEVADQYRECGNIGAAFAKLIDTCETAGMITSLLNTTVTAFDAALDQFEENYTAIVNKIYEINPDIDIIGFGCYNPMNYFRISGDSDLNIDAILAPVLLRLNGFIESFTKGSHAGHYFYADVNGTETYHMSLDDKLMWDYFSFKVHPTLAGHRYMAAQALNALSAHANVFPGIGNVHYVRLFEQLCKNLTNDIIVLFAKLLGSVFVFGPVSFGR